MGDRWPDRSVCLDLTRTVSRAGGGPATGIDRVERAWLDTLLDSGCDLTGLVRHAGGISVLERAALEELRGRIARPGTGRRDAVGLLSRRIGRTRQALETWVRRNATATVWRGWESGRLRRALPAGALYLNVGHANLSQGTLAEIGAAARIGVFVHDVIPMRHPEFQRPGTSERFGEKLAAVARHADMVACPSESEARHVAQWLGRPGDVLAVVPGPTGSAPDPAALPPGAMPEGPYFVALGTIEPRKNIGLLLEVWERCAAANATTPGLVIVGRRGWEEPATFARLDAHRAARGPVREVNDLSDGAAAALVAGAEALLFPTLAEGYGFPPHEALALGTPVVCSDLDVLRETLGQRVVYADPRDVVQWFEIVCGMRRNAAGSDGPGQAAETGCRRQTWRSHVQAVLSALG